VRFFLGGGGEWLQRSCVSNANVRTMKRFLFKEKTFALSIFFNLKMDIIERGPFYEKLQSNDSSWSIAGFKLLQ
jgi:hypothetical protein